MNKLHRSRKDAMYPNTPKRQPRRISYNGFNLTVREWVKKINDENEWKISVGCIQTRLSYEWPVEKMLTTPPNKGWCVVQNKSYLNNKKKNENVTPI